MRIGFTLFGCEITLFETDCSQEITVPREEEAEEELPPLPDLEYMQSLKAMTREEQET